MIMHCADVQVTPTDAGLIGFIFGVAFASVFFTAIFHWYSNARRRDIR